MENVRQGLKMRAAPQKRAICFGFAVKPSKALIHANVDLYFLRTPPKTNKKKKKKKNEERRTKNKFSLWFPFKATPPKKKEQLASKKRAHPKAF